MRFAQPYYSYGFWIVIFLIALIFLVFKNRRSVMRRFARQTALNDIASSVNFKNQIIKSALIAIVFFFGTLALMRPQWGFQWQEVKRMGLDILIAIDTSKSMLATDVKPSRLERSKLAVRDLVKKLEGDRIGLIAFSGTAFLQCPLTIDYSGFLLALNDIKPDLIPRGGTSISSAIKVAIETYKQDTGKYKILIIITDGEDHEGGPAGFAEEAKAQGIRIFCIGIGTKEGELIQVADESGKKSFLKDRQGNVIKTRLGEDVLQKIAFITGGTYVRSSGVEFGLELIYDEKLSKLEKREIKSQMSKNYYERFQIPLAVALALLIAEFFITDKKRR